MIDMAAREDIERPSAILVMWPWRSTWAASSRRSASSRSSIAGARVAAARPQLSAV